MFKECVQEHTAAERANCSVTSNLAFLSCWELLPEEAGKMEHFIVPHFTVEWNELPKERMPNLLPKVFKVGG